MNNIALGRYLPLDSVIHRMDPRAKICAMLITMIAIFIPAGYSGYLVLGLCLACDETDAVHARVPARHQPARHP